jgi:hypothetical protein
MSLRVGVAPLYGESEILSTPFAGPYFSKYAFNSSVL